MTENNNLPTEMTVDEALQYADEQTMGATFYAGKRDLQAVLLVLISEIRNRREPAQPPYLIFLKMTVDEALQYADDRITGATFYAGKRDLQMVLALLVDEVRRLRKQAEDN